MPSKPSVFVPTLYFAEGLPWTIVNKMSVVVLKNLSMGNDLIGLFTSVLYIPWVSKLFWAPLVDLYGTRRTWVITTQAVLAVISALLAVAMFLPGCAYALLGGFAIMAFVSATQDISVDGYYLSVLPPERQAFYVGIRSSAYKVAVIVGTGALVYLAGMLAEKVHVSYAIQLGWCCAFAVCAVLFAGLAIFHMRALPIVQEKAGSEKVSKTDAGTDKGNLGSAFITIFLDFLDQPKIFVILSYVLIFRLGDAFLLKMAQPFLLDPIDKGGLGLTTANVGLIDGTIGTICLLLGGIIGGGLISKYGLKRFMMPFAIVQNSALILYWMLAVNKPNYFAVGCVDGFEQFSYGLGTAAYTCFLMTTVKEKYQAAQYAIVTAFMALGVMVPGLMSGFLMLKMGYANFFLMSFIVSLPGIALIPFLPVKDFLGSPPSKTA